MPCFFQRQCNVGIGRGVFHSIVHQNRNQLPHGINAPVNDAVNAEQLLNVESGTITIDAGDDALHCDLVMNVGADGTDGPTITITNAYEGLEAATLNIASGNIDITCSDDCLNAASSLLTDYDFAMNISGGTIRAYTTAGDGFDSNGTMTISGGGIEVWTANSADNQPLDADGRQHGQWEHQPDGGRQLYPHRRRRQHHLFRHSSLQCVVCVLLIYRPDGGHHLHFCS